MTAFVWLPPAFIAMVLATVILWARGESRLAEQRAIAAR